MKASRWAGVIAGVLLFAACGPNCGGATSSSSSGNGCAHPGVCLTLTGPLSGTTKGLIGHPDCIPGGGLDAVFTSPVSGNETSIEILITDDSAKSSPGFHPGTFQVKSRGGTVQGTAYASIWIKPDREVTGFHGGWSTDGAGSSGTVEVRADESGTVKDAVVAPVIGEGGSIRLSGSFNCS